MDGGCGIASVLGWSAVETSMLVAIVTGEERGVADFGFFSSLERHCRNYNTARCEQSS